MKRTKWIVLLGLVSAINFVGCGRVYTGSYTGLANYAFSGTGQTVPSALSMSITQNGNAVTGQFSSTLFNGQLSGGMVTGDTITGVTLTLSYSGSAGSTGSFVSVPLAQGTSCLYTGSFTASGNWPSTILSGSLNSVSNNSNSIYGGAGVYGTCPTLQIPSVTKIN